MATSTNDPYDAAQMLADRVNNTNSNVQNAINQTVNSINNPSSGTDYASALTNAFAVPQEQNYANINQQYNNSGRYLQDYMASKGLDRSGSMVNRLTSNEQNRNAALSNAASTAQQQQQSNVLAAMQLANSIANTQNQNQYNQATLTGQYTDANGGTQSTLAAQQLAQQIAQQAIANKYTEAGLTGQYNGQSTLDAQQLDASKQAAINQLAANIMSSYAQGTDQFTLPSSVTDLINRIFKNAT